MFPFHIEVIVTTSFVLHYRGCKTRQRLLS